MPSTTFLACLALAMDIVCADLGAAVRKAQGQALRQGYSLPNLPAQAALQHPMPVELEKRRSIGTNGIEAVFYVANVTVGHPAQQMEVMFDTGSGTILLPHRACQSTACQHHRRYSPWESSTAMDVGIDGGLVQKGQRLAKGTVMRDVATIGFSQADLGDGEAKTVLVRDSVCFTSHAQDSACVDMPLLAAINLDDKPFAALPSDGIVGLGLAALSPEGCNFLRYLFEGSSSGVSKVFGMYLGAEKGQLMLGDVNKDMISGPLTWFEVDHPKEGYWQVAIRSVRLGGIVMDSCSGGCHGVVDTGASRLGVQQTVYGTMHSELLRSLSPSAAGQCVGPLLEIDLGDMVLELGPEDYADGNCDPLLGSLALEEPKFVGVYSLGEIVLRHYYAAFDWENERVGFARVAGQPARGHRGAGQAFARKPIVNAMVV